MTRMERIEAAMVELLASAVSQPGIKYQFDDHELSCAYRCAEQIVNHVDLAAAASVAKGYG